MHVIHIHGNDHYYEEWAYQQEIEQERSEIQQLQNEFE